MSGSIPEIIRAEYARSRPGNSRVLRVVDWNIDRGEDFNGILDFLRRADADLLLLQEVDINARRTHRRNVAEEIARALQLNFVWAREFEELVQESKDSPAYQGQTTMSRWPIRNARAIRFRAQSGFWKPHWFVPHVEPFQVRVGGRISLVSEIDVGGRKVVAYNLHLESRNTDRLRMSQTEEILADAARIPASVPVIMAGDFNMNMTHRAPVAAMEGAGFQAAMSAPQSTTHLWRINGPAIDWVYSRGSAQIANLKIHSSVHASDHFPITFDVRL